MIVTHDGDRTIADTAALVALLGRSAWSVRTLCRREPAGYDLDTCSAALDASPAEPVLLNASQAQQYLGLAAGTVRKWASRKRITSHATDPAGRPLYALDDLLQVAGRAPRTESTDA